MALLVASTNEESILATNTPINNKLMVAAVPFPGEAELVSPAPSSSVSVNVVTVEADCSLLCLKRGDDSEEASSSSAGFFGLRKDAGPCLLSSRNSIDGQLI